MSQKLKSLVVGVASGVATFFLAISTLAITNALVLPNGFPLAVWDVLVVFGLGVTLVALLIHFVALAASRSHRMGALVGFALAFVICLGATGLLQTGIKALLAAVIGAVLATLIMGLRSNNSFKPSPLRGLGPTDPASGGPA